MTDSMNLDSADLVESLEFGSLDTSLEEELDMLSHEEHITVNEIDVSSEVLMKDETDVIKEEVVEHMEEEGVIMEETITFDDARLDNRVIDSVMDVVEDQSYHDDEDSTLVHDTSDMPPDNDIFTDDVITEEIVADEQVIVNNDSHIYEANESEGDFEDMHSIMNHNVVTEETVIEASENVEETQQDVVESETISQNTIVSSDVFVVNPPTISTPTNIQANTIISSKDMKISRVLAPGEGQTLRIALPSGKTTYGGIPKTITLAQAKQMGLINFTIPSSSKGGLNKIVMPKKTVTVMKSPTKILPAPAGGRGQKVMFRSASGSLKAGTLLTTSTSTPVLRIPGAPGAQLHLNNSNKQFQIVKFVGTNKGGTTLVPVQTISKSIPVALSTSTLNPQQTFKVVPVSSQASSVTTTQAVTGGQRILIPASAAQVAVQQTPQRQSIVMLQPQILSPVKEDSSPVLDESGKASTESDVSNLDKGGSSSLNKTGKRAATPNLKKEDAKPVEVKSEPDTDIIEANGIRPRKPCNCTKSMCLKLYCDCFANGEFCYQCNCTTCYNNLQHEEERQRAIKSCLERNPTAFRPKIGKTYVGSDERRHNKGCNCRRSGCLKNYCECYEAKIPCSRNCKCIGCKNTDAFFKRGITHGVDDDRGLRDKGESASRNLYEPYHLSGHRQVLNYMSPQLMEATCQCLVAQVEEWSRSGSPDLDLAQALVIEELGRCLAQLIECIHKSIGQFPQLS